MSVDPLLGLIRQKESRDDYNAVWGGIGRQHQPPRPLVTMTVQEVLDWQDSIDPLYNSEASGAYQVLEDTLRGLVRTGRVSARSRFNVKTQDNIAMHLLRRRGLDDFVEGKITPEKFANSIAKEWASFPVVTRVKGQSRTVEPGQSYYAGDGLNKALAKPEAVMAAVRAISSVGRTPWWLRLIRFALKRFGK